MFTIIGSTTDYYVTFIEHFPINIRNASNYTVHVTQDLVTFEVKIYPNGTDTKYKGYVCVIIELISSPQDTVDLHASVSIKHVTVVGIDLKKYGQYFH